MWNKACEGGEQESGRGVYRGSRMPKTHELVLGDAIRISDAWGSDGARPLHERYRDEAEFRAEFVKPLLQKLCDLEVAETHGPEEYGKDFVFAELDRLGCVRYCAVQVKHCKLLRKGTQSEDLLRAINEAFDVPVRLSVAGEQRIAVCYVFVSGRLSPQARRRVLEGCKEGGRDGKVFLLDGDRLAQLDRCVSYRVHAAAREVLGALLFDLTYNLGLARSILERTSQPIQGRALVLDAFRLTGLDATLRAPLGELIDMGIAADLWETLQAANRGLDMLLFRPGGYENKPTMLAATRKLIMEAQPRMVVLTAAVKEVLEALRAPAG